MKESKKIISARNEAFKLIKKNGMDSISIRSCWNCNPAHEHLKKANYIIHCYECGRFFYKGLDVTVQDEKAPEMEGE